MERIKIHTENIDLDLKVNHQRFEDIIKEVKNQGGNITAYIIESVLYRTNALKNNPFDCSAHLELDKNAYSYNLVGPSITQPINAPQITTIPQHMAQEMVQTEEVVTEYKTENEERVLLDNDSFFDDDDDL